MSTSDIMCSQNGSYENEQPESKRSKISQSLNSSSETTAAKPRSKGYAVMILGVSQRGDSDEHEPVYAEGLQEEHVQHIALATNSTSRAYVLTTEGVVKQWGPPLQGDTGKGWDSVKHKDRTITETVGSFHGQSGQEHPEEDRVVQVESGFNYSASVTMGGAIFTWGDGQYAKLGHGQSQRSIATPTQVQSLRGIPIKQVACGDDFAIALTKESGQVWSWGRNDYGCTGLGVSDGIQATPKQITGGWQITQEGGGNEQVVVTQISAFFQSSGAVTSEGRVFTWGSNDSRALGVGSDCGRLCLVPTIVRGALMKPREDGGGFHAVRHIACGRNHMLALTRQGRVYSWGCNGRGQLGLGSSDEHYQAVPAKVSNLEGVIVEGITCGRSHSAVVTDKGELFTWGCNAYRQLGLSTHKSEVFTPKKVEKFSSMTVCKVICGIEHTLALVDPASLPPNDSLPIQSALQSMLDNDDSFKDVSFKTQDGVVIRAHRAILSQRCPFFNRMFLSGLRESQDTNEVIQIPNMTSRIFNLVLIYLYTEKFSIHISDAVKLYQAADLYGLDNLRKLCLQAVHDQVTFYNVCLFLRSAAESHCGPVQEICILFMVKHFKEVSSSSNLATIPHELLLEVLRRFGKAP